MNKKRKGKKTMAWLLAAAMAAGSLPALPALAAPETVAGGYEIDMEDLPQVHFAKHKNWEELYQKAWQSHKNNIKKVTSGLNPEAIKDGDAWYVDEAFDGTIFQWDTLLMMMFDKYGYHQFPTLNSIDNFYAHQVDSDGDDDGYICRRINESNGSWSYKNYLTVDAINPPLFGWAEWEQYKVHGDVSRFTKVIKGKTVLERLDSFFQFLKRTRTHKDGKWTGLYVSNGQGNGLDNTPNQDWGGWGQAANDMSIQQVQAAHYISLIAKEVVEKDATLTEEEKAEYTALAEQYEQEEAELKALVQEKMWDAEDGFYYNLNSNGDFTSIATPTGLWSLSAGIPSKEQAEKMIKTFTQNSEKMFRPNGLSTVCYDYSTFKSTGGYWNGAMWSPTSYVWIKGLQEYGYEDLAFQEAVRHINALSDVYEQGAYDRYGNKLNTLWENYSSEYTKPGSTENSDSQPSRSNFVGWTGALAIGSMIEDIIGVTMDASENTVDWNVNLSEEHGVSGLYMNSQENGENRISLEAKGRNTVDAGLTVEVTCDKPFTLNLSCAERSQVIAVEAGTHTYTLEGKAEGEEAYLGIMAKEYEKSGLTAEDVENARDYVYFTEQEDASIMDGLKNQAGGEADFIYNVNTVGNRAVSRSPMTYEADEKLQELSFTDAVDCVRTPYSLGEDGFMFMVPADNKMKTVKAIVGVQNAEAVVNVQMSDGSSKNVSQVLKAGNEEETYVVEIPYRAASEGQNMLVEYVITSDSGSIRLKGILAEDGGRVIAGEPENLTVESMDSALKISADVPEGENFDSWNIYVSRDGSEKLYEAEALPYVVEGLENDTRYEVCVAGVVNGQEGRNTEKIAQVPEKTARTEEERARFDWEKAFASVLNGNADADHIEKRLNFDVAGPVYGSSISITSSTADEKYGVMENGGVSSPILPAKDLQVILTAVITLGETTVTIKQPVTVIAKAEDEVPCVLGSKTDKVSGEINLTEEGSKDWIQFTSASVSDYAKKTGEAYISDICSKGTLSMVGDSPFTYLATDAGEKKPVNNSSVGIRGMGNGFSFHVPYSEKVQHVTVYPSVWAGDVTVEMEINGVTMYRDSYGRPDTGSGMKGQAFDIAYRIPNETDEAILKIYCSNNLDNTWGGCVVALSAVTLRETDETITPPKEEEPSIRAKMVSQPTELNLTEEGTADWILFNTTDVNKLERKAGGTQITELSPLQAITKIGTAATGMVINYTDGTIKESGSFNKASVYEKLGNGISFVTPYSRDRRDMKIYFGAWSAKTEIKFEILKDSELVEEKTMEFDTGSQAGGTPALYRMIHLTYGGENGDALRVTIKNSALYNATWGNTCIQAVTLAGGETEKKNSIAREGLEKLIAMAEILEASEYTAESWKALEDAVAAAKGVAEDADAVQAEIDAAVSSLIAAYGNLEYGVQKLHLEVAIEAAEKILALGKNYEDIESLTKAVEDGKAVLADENASQETVDGAAYAVLDELFKMAKTADISSLESLIEAAKGLLDGKYTSDSLESLKDAIDAAEEVVADQNRGDTDISDAYGNLIDAIINLELKGNKAALEAMLKKANEVLADAKAYVAETIEGLAEVAAEAQAVYDNEDALQSEVNEAVKALTLKVAEARLLGDVDADGEITTADSAAVLRSAAEIDTLSAEAAASADVNGDGAADTSDAVLILQYAAEKIAAF